MRKILLFIVCIAFFLSLINDNKDNKEIRVRVIPNSNSTFDLKEKERAKSIIVGYLNSVYDEDYAKCKQNIENTLDELNTVLSKEFNEICASFDKHTLYNKTYNNNAVKNENYYTLYVIIGNGNGDNWWGTIYPNLLKVSSSEEVKYESLFANLFKKIKEN